MEIIILVASVSLLLSAWALSYTFSCARNSIQRHTAWHARKRQDLERKMKALLEQEAVLQARIAELEQG